MQTVTMHAFKHLLPFTPGNDLCVCVRLLATAAEEPECQEHLVH